MLSPRDIEMMALLTVSHLSSEKDDVIDQAKYYAYILSKHLIPPGYQTEFEKQFAAKKGENEDVKEEKVSLSKQLISPGLGTEFEELAAKNSSVREKEEKSEFLVTSSRKFPSQLLDDFLQLRAWRREEVDGKSRKDVHKYGGLGAITLEGLPSAGKSDLVIARLRAMGFHEVYYPQTAEGEKNVFYRMPAGMGVKEKEALLVQAFDEGAVVIADELNSASTMEKLVNDLLMGRYNGDCRRPLKKEKNKDSDSKNNDESRPVNPGFLLIGTQNPPSMAGRLIASDALSKRGVLVSVPPYSPDEIHKILSYRKINPETVDELVEAYKIQLEKVGNDTDEAPTLRDLIKIEEHLKASHKKEELVEEEKPQTDNSQSETKSPNESRREELEGEKPQTNIRLSDANPKNKSSNHLDHANELIIQPTLMNPEKNGNGQSSAQELPTDLSDIKKIESSTTDYKSSHKLNEAIRNLITLQEKIKGEQKYIKNITLMPGINKQTISTTLNNIVNELNTRKSGAELDEKMLLTQYATSCYNLITQNEENKRSPAVQQNPINNHHRIIKRLIEIDSRKPNTYAVSQNRASSFFQQSSSHRYKKLIGYGLILLGALTIGASIGFMVATHFVGTPVSFKGISLGINLISMGAGFASLALGAASLYSAKKQTSAYNDPLLRDHKLRG